LTHGVDGRVGRAQLPTTRPVYESYGICNFRTNCRVCDYIRKQNKAPYWLSMSPEVY